MTDIPAWLQTILTLATIIGGCIVVIAKLSHKFGKLESRIDDLDEKFDCGKAEHQHFYGRLNKIDQKVAVVESTQVAQAHEITRLKNA